VGPRRSEKITSFVELLRFVAGLHFVARDFTNEISAAAFK